MSVEHAVRTVIISLARYGHDTHGLAICKIPAYVLNAPSSKPYYIPFRALTSDGAINLLVAGKTMAASFSANSATRLHPEEWSTGPHALSPAIFHTRSPVHLRLEMHIAVVRKVHCDYFDS